MIQFNCPSCDVRIDAKPKRAGTPGRCPKCGNDLHIPDSPDADSEVVHEGSSSQVEPYDVKGDRLGVSLDEFKATQRWVNPGSERRALWGSGRQPGITECHYEFRMDGMGNTRQTPTFAGVKPEGVSYEFVEEHLYRIRIQISRKDFETVSLALAAKYGKPETKRRPVQSTWSNGVSTIILELTQGLVERTGHESLVSFVHDRLNKSVLDRTTVGNADDL